MELPPDAQPRVTLTVLKSFDKATSFLRDLNRILLGLGLLSVIAGSVLVFFISDTFTRPLANLVAGVRALEGGDYGFPLGEHGRRRSVRGDGRVLADAREHAENAGGAAASWRSGCARRTRWRPWAGWRAAWRTISIIC